MQRDEIRALARLRLADLADRKFQKDDVTDYVCRRLSYPQKGDARADQGFRALVQKIVTAELSKKTNGLRAWKSWGSPQQGHWWQRARLMTAALFIQSTNEYGVLREKVDARHERELAVVRELRCRGIAGDQPVLEAWDAVAELELAA